MAVVTGDRYLNSLVKFVDKHTGSLLDGTLILKLNPVGLHYIQSRLESLQEVECLLAGAPIDYLRAYISDLGDHRALEQLRRILRLLTSLKIMSMVPPPGRDPTPLCLLPFGRIKVLELRGCDLSTSAARGLLELRHTLEKIICHNSTDALRHVFASRIADIKDSPLWNRLSLVSCAHNGLVLMDESLQLLPVVETLDLSRNRFAKVDNLRKCTKLRHLDLGFNHLRTIASLSEVVCPIVKLVLRNNALTTLRGIENLTSVEGLDLSYNIISSFSELELLAGLSSLRSLWLEGNPICCARWYRAQVFSFFAQPEMLKLDERTISKKESWKRQIILASRQKKPAGYGFYIPAKDEAEEEGSFYAKQRKTSRLACIEDEERRRYFGPEAVDLESVSCDSETPKRDENVISESEAEIVGLMNRVEFMKKERSVLWLREFGEWMDQTSMDMVNGNKFIESISTTGKEKYMKRKKSQKHLGETSTYVSESVQASGDESSTNILESDYSFADTVIGSHGPEYFDPNSKDVLDGSRDSIPVLRIGGMGSEQDQLMTYSHEEPNLLPLAATNSFLTDTLKVERGDMPYSKVNSTALTALDEIMESRSSSIYPGSPPHYQEDILHRRQNLEEEFLQLSAESLSVASSDSDTSCSDDDSYHFETSFPRVDRLLNEVPLDKSRSNHPDVLLFEDNYHEKRHGDPQTIENNRSLLDFHTEPASTVVKSLKTDHSEPCCTDGILADAGGGSINQECLEKGKAKRKPKRRVVSLPEQNCMAGNTKLLFPKLNGVSEIGKVDIKLRVERPVFIENDYHKPHEKVDEQASMNEVKSPPIYGAGSSLRTKSGSPNPEIDEFIKNYFDAQITGSRVSETCLQFMLCNCILQQGSGFGECEIAVLLSSENKLYMLQMSATHDGPGTISKVLGCHRLEDIKEVVIGIGLHIMRVHTENDASYLFITRSVEQSRRLLCLLQLCDSSGLTNTCALRSWEQVQVKLFEKHICGGLKMSIFLYSMLLFWHNDSKGESWLLRSLFVIEGYMFLCIEDLVQFSSLTDDTGLSAYFSLDSCCHISSISEMIIEPRESRCLTLTLDHLTSEKIRFPFQLEKEKQSEEDTSGSCTWKLKWFSEDTLLKFVSLLKAIHAGVSASPLPVRCIP